MDINQAFPSNYLRACDLQGRTVTVKIASVGVEKVGQEGDTKPVMHFEGKEKGVILNKTKSTTLQNVFGPETNHWIGQIITLAAGQTNFKGELVACINFGIVPVASPTQNAQLPPVKESFTAQEAEEIVAAEVAGADVGDGDNTPF